MRRLRALVGQSDLRVGTSRPALPGPKWGQLMSTVTSQQVSWWSVHEFVGAVLDQANSWPMLGTPAWCSLAHDDPRKWAALLDGAQHHALRLELNQEARAEAAKAVSRAADWPQIAREIQRLNNFRASRPWARRAAS
jgi:hypothetical protein